MQTLIITRVIFSLLAVPVAIIVAAMFILVMTFYLFTVSAPLALIPLGVGGAAIAGLYRWEQARVNKEMGPRDEP